MCKENIRKKLQLSMRMLIVSELSFCTLTFCEAKVNINGSDRHGKLFFQEKRAEAVRRFVSLKVRHFACIQHVWDFNYYWTFKQTFINNSLSSSLIMLIARPHYHLYHHTFSFYLPMFFPLRTSWTKRTRQQRTGKWYTLLCWWYTLAQFLYAVYGTFLPLGLFLI